MGLRRSKTTPALTEVARQWNRSPIPTGPSPDPRDPEPRPSGFLSSGIILALLIMVGGVVWIYKSGVPQQASAKSAAPAPNHEAIAAALEAAKTYVLQNDYKKSDLVLLQAAVKHPDNQELRIMRAEGLVAMQRYPEAYSQYEKALAIGPRDPKLEFAAGITASKASMIERAIEHFSMAQSTDPHNANYALWLGQMQRKQGNVDAAKASLLRSANLDPGNAFVWGTLAEIALGENNANIAIQHVSKARSLQPDSTEWRVIEARALKRRGEPEKALTVLNAIEPLQRRDPSVARIAAECYGMLGRPVDAAALLGDSSLAFPTDGALAYDAALAFERAGNKAKAIEFAKYAKALGVENATKLLAKLTE